MQRDDLDLDLNVELDAVDGLRAVLDQFSVAARLQHIRQFIWRGGTLELRSERGGDSRVRGVAYVLAAAWPAPLLEAAARPRDGGLEPRQKPVLDGRWVRGSNGYSLRVGIDVALPVAMYIRSHRLEAHVPFVGRVRAQVEEALQAELTAYAHGFLNHFEPVPQAAAVAARRLRELGLAA